MAFCPKLLPIRVHSASGGLKNPSRRLRKQLLEIDSFVTEINLHAHMKRTFGSILTGIGVIFILFASIAFMSDKAVLGFTLTKWETIVPFLVGILFLLVGVNLLVEIIGLMPPSNPDLVFLNQGLPEGIIIR